MVDVPVAPGAPQAGGAVRVPVAPAAPAAGGWGAPAVAPPAPAVTASPPALPSAPVILPPPRPVPSLPGPFRTPQRRSLAEMANEQLGVRKPRDPLAEGMGAAAREDCLRGSGTTGTVGGLLAAPALVGRAAAGDCPR